MSKCRTIVKRRQTQARMLALLLGTGAVAAHAGVHVNVTTTADEYGTGAGCSLREALHAIRGGANFGGCTRAGAQLFDQINLPAGTYAITLPPVPGNPEAGGAFKVGSSVSITGAGAAQTTVDGAGIDSALNVTFASGQQLNLSGMTIRNGTNTIARGAGINQSGGGMSLSDVWVTATVAGYGIYSAQPESLKLSRTTLSGHHDTALVIVTSGAVTTTTLLENTTISGNVSPTSAGALHVDATNGAINNVTIADSTVADNTGSVIVTGAAGVYFSGAGAHATVLNSIIARNLNDNRVPADCVSSPNTVVSQGYNLLGPQYMCSFIGSTATDIVGVDPQLAPLFDYGNGVPTHAVYPGSPALGAGNPAAPGSGGQACVATDARGINRTNTQPCDIGAYEYHVDWRPNSTQDISDIIADGSCNVGFGMCTLRGAIDEANAAGRPVTIEIPAGNYVITKPPATQNSNVDGNFTVTTLFPVTLVGAGADQTFIDGGGLDSVLTLGVPGFGGVALHGVTVRNGSKGGVFVNHGPALFDHVRVTANQNFFGNGVAILNGGSADFVASTVDHNLTIGTTNFCGGGGIAADTGTRVSLLNSTVANNTSNRYGSGICSNGADVTIAFSTIANNVQATDSTQGGLADGANPGIWHIINSIVAGNTLSSGGAADCGATLQVDGHTLVQAASGCTFGGAHANQVISGTDPQLTSLTMQGGTTPTIGARPASPVHAAIQQNTECTDNTGNELFADQRDAARPLNSPQGQQYCDIGSYQGSSDVIFANGFE